MRAATTLPSLKHIAHSGSFQLTVRSTMPLRFVCSLVIVERTADEGNHLRYCRRRSCSRRIGQYLLLVIEHYVDEGVDMCPVLRRFRLTPQSLS